MDPRRSAHTIRHVLDAIGPPTQETLVVAGLDKAGGIVALASLPMCPPDEIPPLGDIARQVEGALLGQGAAHAVCIAVTRMDLSFGCALADTLAAEWTALAMTHQWWVTADRYREPGCADHACCPPGGKRLDYGSAASAAERKRAHRAGDRFASRSGVDPGWRDAAWDHVSAVVRGSDEALTVGKALAALRDVHVRDALIVLWAVADADASQDVLNRRDTAVARNALSCLAAGGLDRVPIGATEACDVLEAFARAGDAALVLSLRALIAWVEGDSNAAGGFAMSALRADPGYSLAYLITRKVDVGAARAYGARGR